MNLQESHFYLVVPPGLEKLAYGEFKLKWSEINPESPIPDLILRPGGLEFKTDLSLGCSLNYYLKIPTRNLLVIDEFKCRDFPKLFKKISKMSWRDYLIGQFPDIKISSKKSKLFDSRRIIETTLDGIKKYYKGQPPKEKDQEKINDLPPTVLFIRFNEDLCTISIDTGGEPLFKRSYRPFIEKAPLRENLASALVFQLKNFLAEENPLHLIDPMCGSGTFLIEAGQFWHPNTSRDYSFNYFPCLKKSNSPKPHSLKGTWYSEFHGFDKERKAIETCHKNNKILDQEILFGEKDLFENIENLTIKNPDNSVIICNPPYGERIKTEEDPIQFLNKALIKMTEAYNPLLLGILFLREKCLKIKAPKNYKIVNSIDFQNGGIDVSFLTIKKG
jgi:putative N6-adenine-specific DNA methylase